MLICDILRTQRNRAMLVTSSALITNQKGIDYMDKCSTENEIWEDIKGYEGYYQISETGKVLSVRNSFILSPTTSNGYKEVVLSVNHIKGYKLIHRLVAEAFIPNVDNKPEVNHIDGDKLNNNINNLEWVTRVENAKHAGANGLMPSGEKNHMVVLSKSDVNKIIKLRYIHKLEVEDIANLFNVSISHLSQVVNGDTWHFEDEKLVGLREGLLNYKPNPLSDVNESNVHKVLELRYEQGLSYTKISDALHIPKTTVGRIIKGTHVIYRDNDNLLKLLDSYK